MTIESNLHPANTQWHHCRTTFRLATQATAWLVFLGVLSSLGCTEPQASKDAPSVNMKVDRDLADQPNKIRVQHCLISFLGATGKEDVTRSLEEAETLANELFEKARQDGADFDGIVKAYSDDGYPGYFTMVNEGLAGDTNNLLDRKDWVYPRKDLVDHFGDVSFGLDVGEVGMAKFDRNGSPFGFHIIKRVE